jgi:F-type H+-transporting ATPase subunit a
LISLAIPLAADEKFVSPGVADFWQPLIGDGAFAITRSMIVYAVTAIALTVVLVRITRNLKVVPGKAQFGVEGVYGLVRNGLARDIIGAEHFKPFLPLVFSLFTVILANNLLGVFPIVQFPTLSRLGYAVVLTAIVYITYHAVGIRQKGLGGWLKSWVPPGLPTGMIPVMWFLEALTYLIFRPLTMALRIFGNMFAGHLMLLVFTFGGEYLLLHGAGLLHVTGVLSFIFAIGLYFFEILIEFLQAYIFVLLTCVYIAGAVADEH